MWQTYSKSYLRHNPAVCISVMGATLFATTFLSAICSLAYNLWAYEIDRMASEGSPAVAATLTPLVILFLVLLAMVSFSLALIIRSSFEMSMGARMHQFGILSSIGATPKQIRTILMQEAAVLCVIPIGLGALLGIVICYGVMESVNYFAADVAGRQDAVFQYHPGILAVTVLSSGLTVFVSQYSPARKLSKLTPIEAIRNGNGFQLKKQRNSPLLSLLFGFEGTIAGNALKAQKKSLRIANLSLFLSFLGFSIILCFTTLSAISTRHTYFERYQDCWDVMVTVKDTSITSFDPSHDLQKIPGVRNATVYQKADSTYLLSEESQSAELLALGGYEAINAQKAENGYFQIPAPIIVLDDDSFLMYCQQIGIAESLNGAIILNRIWDNTHSNFRYKAYIPFIDPSIPATTLVGMEEEFSVLAYTQEAPALREEYPNYALVHFLPRSLWESLGTPGAKEADTYIRIFTSGNASLTDLDTLQTSVAQCLPPTHEILIENRVQERISNDRMIAGMQWILGFFCALLALVGVANVFSNTLGFLRNRKREFAQYMSIGLTPQQLRKLFCIEAFVIAGKPLVLTFPLTVLFVAFATTASYLDPGEFWSEAPVFPMLAFAAAIVLFISLAYYVGGKSILHCDLSETLRNDSIM